MRNASGMFVGAHHNVGCLLINKEETRKQDLNSTSDIDTSSQNVLTLVDRTTASTTGLLAPSVASYRRRVNRDTGEEEAEAQWSYNVLDAFEELDSNLLPTLYKTTLPCGTISTYVAEEILGIPILSNVAVFPGAGRRNLSTSLSIVVCKIAD